MNVKVEEPGKNNIHNNAFYAEETLLRSELQAMRDCNPLSARHWIVIFFSGFHIYRYGPSDFAFSHAEFQRNVLVSVCCCNRAPVLILFTSFCCACVGDVRMHSF